MLRYGLPYSRGDTYEWMAIWMHGDSAWP